MIIIRAANFSSNLNKQIYNIDRNLFIMLNIKLFCFYIFLQDFKIEILIISCFLIVNIFNWDSFVK